MSVVTRAVRVDAPPAAVWKALADVGGIARWSPNVRASHSTSEHNGGIGATRHCDLRGGSVEERVVAWEEGRMLTIEIYDAVGAPARIARASVSFDVTPAGAGTLVSATIDYALKGGPLGSLMDALVGRRQFGQTAEQLLAGLGEHVQTGKQVDFGRRLTFEPVLAA